VNSTLQELAPESRVSGKQQSRHQELLDQSARQLNVRGVLRTSLGEIAATLGVSRNALDYYVSGRQDLLFQCYQRAALITAERLTEAIRVGSNAAEALRDFVLRMMDPRGRGRSAPGCLQSVRPGHQRAHRAERHHLGAGQPT
jgi:AcrR family transcriptional regulator